MHQTSITSMSTAILALMLFNTTPVSADEHEHREHSAHEHGVAQLNIAQEGNTLHLELASPAMNLIGFEHEPRNKQQHTAVKQAVAQLQKGAQLFHLTPAASCSLTKHDVDTPLLEQEHEHEAGHDKEEHEGEHADFDASYVFKCKQPAALRTIEVKLFKLFPGTEEMEVQLLTDQGQRALELTPSNPTLHLK